MNGATYEKEKFFVPNDIRDFRVFFSRVDISLLGVCLPALFHSRDYDDDDNDDVDDDDIDDDVDNIRIAAQSQSF
nr:hypothetical protein BaRGS_013898 [Batillaria attramentaria]